jgi:hypothetical protein
MKRENKLLAGICLLASGVAVFFAYRFYPQVISAEIANWGQFGDFFGGIFNPLIGLVTAYFAYQAYQNTKVSAQQQKFVATIETYIKIHDAKIAAVSYSELHGETALKRMVDYLATNVEVKLFTNDTFQGASHPSTMLDEFVSQIAPFINAMVILENQLTDDEKLKFYEIISAYSSFDLATCIQQLSVRTNYEPADSITFDLIKHVAKQIAKKVVSQL